MAKTRAGKEGLCDEKMKPWIGEREYIQVVEELEESELLRGELWGVNNELQNNVTLKRY